jgi:aspartate-semialdehyde dehydrogenase
MAATGDSWHSRIIANPNCTTAILALILAPLARSFGGLEVVIASTYQAASGAGEPGIRQLKKEVEGHASAASAETTCTTTGVFAYPLLYNLIPSIDSSTPNGYTKEEMKLSWETRKLLEDPDIRISCTCVRVPTLRAHAAAVTVRLKEPCLVSQVKKLLETTAEAGDAGFDVVDDLDNGQYPMPLTASGKFNVQVGRIRQSLVFGDNGVDFFVVGDQLLRGAALNAVEIGLKLLELGLLR